MSVSINMPKLSDTMTEGTLVKWHIKKGDKVEIGQHIADVETDKATMEMESFDEGVVWEISVPEGGKAPLGATLAILLEDGETEPSASSAAPAKATTSTSSAATGGAPAQAAASSATVVSVTQSASGRIKASPLARKIAAKRGVDLSRIQGTGPGGRVVAKDVENAPVGQTAPTSAPASVSALPTIRPVIKEGDVTEPVSSMRRIIADRLLASKTQIPHFYLHLEADAGPLMKLRTQVNASAEKTGGIKYSVNDFILKAAVGAIKAVPAINASWNGDSVVKFKHVGLSVAISVEDGLVTPVIKQAETKSLNDISKAVKDLATRARDKKLKPDEFDGGTITVSNLGAWGIESFDAIINPPQAAILSVGAIVKKPVVDASGNIVVGQRIGLGLSADHRVVDGAVAAAYLAEVKNLVENPALSLV